MSWVGSPRNVGAFDVLLEREEFAPGDTVAGMLLLQLHTPLADAVVTVDLRGRECIEVTDHVESDTRTRDHSIWLQAVARQRVSTTTKSVELPFAVELPMDLPATAHFEFGSRQRAETKLAIVYEVVCDLDIANGKSGILTHRHPFTVSAMPLARRLGQPVEKHTTKTFHHGLLLKKSSCHVGVQLNSDVFTVDSPVTARVRIKLDNSDRLESVSAVLWRRLVPNPSQPALAPPESRQVTSVRKRKAELQDPTVLQMTVPPSMVSEFGPLKPTMAFHHFLIAYEVVVTCEIRSCSPILVRLPITLLPIDNNSLSAHAYTLPHQ